MPRLRGLRAVAKKIKRNSLKNGRRKAVLKDEISRLKSEAAEGRNNLKMQSSINRIRTRAKQRARIEVMPTAILRGAERVTSKPGRMLAERASGYKYRVDRRKLKHELKGVIREQKYRSRKGLPFREADLRRSIV